MYLCLQNTLSSLNLFVTFRDLTAMNMNVMEVASSYETSFSIYQTTRSNIPEDSNLCVTIV